MNFILYISKTIGAIFCHVKIIKQFIQFNPSITSGNQKWNGAIPILVNKAELSVMVTHDWKFKLLVRLLLYIITIIEAKIIVEAIA